MIEDKSLASKAPSPILVTEFGMSIVSILVKANALSPIDVIVLGIITDFTE